MNLDKQVELCNSLVYSLVEYNTLSEADLKYLESVIRIVVVRSKRLHFLSDRSREGTVSEKRWKL